MTEYKLEYAGARERKSTVPLSESSDNINNDNKKQQPINRK